MMSSGANPIEPTCGTGTTKYIVYEALVFKSAG
jgi:hypothetical protein